MFSKTTWVIMKETRYPAAINIPSVHMVGFENKREAKRVCDSLNERAASLNYYIEKAKVHQPCEHIDDIWFNLL